MFKTICNMLIGAFIAAAVGAAVAVTGTPPGTGFQLVDSAWLNGLSAGTNSTYQAGLAAAGTTQTTATPIPAGIYLVEIDTTPANSGMTLPFCIAGSEINVYNSVNQTIKFYPNVLNNPLTSAQDTINGGTSLSVTGAAGGTVSFFSCAKNGVWAAK